MTLDYIHKSLHLETPTVLCDMPSDRPNISLFTVPIAKGQIQTREPLFNLLPREAADWDPETFEEDSECWSPWDIPKTLIFIDDRSECCTLTTELIKVFRKDLQASEGRDIVREYHSTMSAKALERNLKALQEGICRIMVCTDAVGMGLDVPDIERVVQWRVPPWLTVSGWWQRAGRAARHPDRTGMAIIYYDRSLRVPPDSPFRGLPDVEEDIEAVYSATLEAASEDQEDAAAAVGKRRKKGALPCEGQLLWYLNTGGCIREVAMHYLGSKPLLRPAFNENDGGDPCCDRCYKRSNVSPDLFAGFEVRTSTPFAEASEDSDVLDAECGDQSQILDSQMPDSQTPGSQAPAQSRGRIRLAVRLALGVWRLQVIAKHISSDSRLRPKHLLPDTLISKLEKHCFDIKQASDIAVQVSVSGRDTWKHTRAAQHTSELAELIIHIVATATAPEPAPREAGESITAGDPKPLYSETEIAAANAVNPEVSQLMETANSALRQHDLMAINGKETARQKRLNKRPPRHTGAGGSQLGASVIAETETVAGSVAPSEAESALSGITLKTDRELMPPPPLPGKRPRGRPPGSKNKPRVAASVTSNVSSGAGSAGAPAHKRPRGRPPGSKNKPPHPPTGSPDQTRTPADPQGAPANCPGVPEEAPGAPPENAPEPKRRRGRPPGSKNRPLPTATASPAQTRAPAISPAVPVDPPAVPANSPAVPLDPPAVPAKSPALPVDPPAVPANSPAVPLDPPAVLANSPAVPDETPGAHPEHAPEPKRRRGRPLGSKNKPKEV
jgi:hypothetical protein